MKKSLLFLFLFILTSISWGQQSAISQGVPEHTSLLLQFEDKEGLGKFKNMDIEWVIDIEEVFVPYNIYKIEINTDIKHIQIAERELSQLPFVKTIQPNRKLERRSIVPNDSLYPIQWNMKKIQMEEAWGITTGGPTTLGDTVVIAIIDAGFDTSHPDFGNNLWVNRHEISGDSVDNDGNGYAGDYYGWNTYSNNDVILDAPEFAIHGMPVTGVIGAVGNNDSGVAGIGWKNKFLVILGDPFLESRLLQAYGYALTQKKIYMETNGAKGAFIVATNSSFGLENKFQDESPLWCAFYDSLGKYGIINVTSVTNFNLNVELNGDLPTLCPSDYTISVTSTNSLENVSGGHGKTSVDLGAPGASIRSTASYVDGRYKEFNGTSLAAPHVTGVVGLLYSAACDSFSNYAKLYPDSAALWIKYFILNGVDTTDQLTNKSVSNGRLNAYKSLLLMQDWCEGKLNSNPANPNPPDTTQIVIPANYTLFPNPGINSFTIKGDISKITRIEVISLTGQIVQKVSLSQIEDPIEITIETPFADGMYFIKTYNQSGEVIFIEKWLKMK